MVFLIFPQDSQTVADIHRDDVERVFGTLRGRVLSGDNIGREFVHLGQISEAGDQLRVMVDHRVLNVEIEDLPHGVEKHRDDEGLGEREREALRGDRAGDDVPSLEVARQRLE